MKKINAILLICLFSISCASSSPYCRVGWDKSNQPCLMLGDFESLIYKDSYIYDDNCFICFTFTDVFFVSKTFGSRFEDITYAEIVVEDHCSERYYRFEADKFMYYEGIYLYESDVNGFVTALGSCSSPMVLAIVKTHKGIYRMRCCVDSDKFKKEYYKMFFGTPSH